MNAPHCSVLRTLPVLLSVTVGGRYIHKKLRLDELRSVTAVYAYQLAPLHRIRKFPRSNTGHAERLCWDLTCWTCRIPWYTFSWSVGWGSMYLTQHGTTAALPSAFFPIHDSHSFVHLMLHKAFQLKQMSLFKPRNKLCSVRFTVLAAVLLQTQFFRDVTLCRRLIGSRSFEGTQFLHLQGSNIPFFSDCLILTTEVARSFETSMTTHPTTNIL